MRNRFSGHPLPVIFFTIFLDLVGFGILLPVIPQLLANPKSPFYLLPAGVSLSDGYILLGFLVASFPIGQFLATPILGQLSDKFGRKKLLALSLAGTCLSYLIFAIGILTRNIPLLFLSRSFDGITGGNISIALASIADITEPKDRSRNFGLVGAAFGLGFIIGPYIGGKLSDPSVVSWFDASTPFWFAAGLSAINIFSVLWFFPETLTKLKIGAKIEWLRSFHNIVRSYALKDLRVLFISIFIFQAGFSFFTTFNPVFLISRFSFTQGNIGDFFAFIGFWIALSQALFNRKLSARFSENQILRVSLIASGVCIFLFFLPTMWWQLLLVVPIFSVFMGLSQANTTALVSRTVDSSVQGEVLGINTSVQALAQSIPPILSGYIAAKILPETPLLVSSIVIIVAGVFFVRYYRPVQVHQLET